MTGGTDTGGDGGTVLIVGPDPRDVRAVSCGLAREDISLDIAANVRPAIGRVTLASESAAPLPDLVALDLTTEPSKGLTVLDASKSSPRLHALPTIALVDPTAPADGEQNLVRDAYRCGVNGHLPRPDDAEAYADEIRRLAAFWFGRVVLPPESLYTDSPSI